MNRTDFAKITTGNFYDRLFAYMELVGLKSIRVNYSGGGDSGGVDNIEYQPSSIAYGIKHGIETFCEEELSNPIYNRHGGFADGGGYDVSGAVDYDAKSKKVSISGTDHNYEYGSSEEDEDDWEVTNERYDPWEEELYDQSKNNSPKDKDYLFALLYARDVLQSKLPEEFHNEMIIAASDQDEHARTYITEYVKYNLN